MDEIKGTPSNPLKQIRTFQGDVADALKRQQESLVTISRREHIKNPVVSNPAEEAATSHRRRRFFFFLLGSLLLFGLGAIGARYTYEEFLGKISTPTIEAPANRFFSPNSEVNVEPNLDSRSALINSLAEALVDVPSDELRHIILKKQSVEISTLVSAEEFLNTLDSRAPGNLVRAFEDPFMFGAVGKSTFIIFKLSSFENAFGGMLTWEANLAEDLGPLMSTAESLRNLDSEMAFSDVTDRNKDARVLQIGGETKLLYSFFDNEMVIVTDSIESLRIVIERLAREKLSR